MNGMAESVSNLKIKSAMTSYGIGYGFVSAYDENGLVYSSGNVTTSSTYSTKHIKFNVNSKDPIYMDFTALEDGYFYCNGTIKKYAKNDIISHRIYYQPALVIAL